MISQEIKEDGKFQIGVQAFLIRDNRVLLGLREEGLFEGGNWSLPGGKLKQRETLRQGFERELREELGILLNPEDYCLVCVADPLPENNFQPQIAFFIKKTNLELVNCEPSKCVRFEWFSLNDLPKNISVASKPLLDKFIAKKVY